MNETRTALQALIDTDDVEGLRALLANHASRRELEDEQDPPLLSKCRSTAAAELLLEHGAGLDHVSRWWAPGFGAPKVNADVGRLLVERGAKLTPHAAAGLGLVESLRDMINTDASVVASLGGDATTPLHFARTVDVARLLVERGADVDARDEDHDSTPAQWLIGRHPDIVRFLLKQGASSDIFLAAALGDEDRVDRHVTESPDCLSLRVGWEPEFPGIGYRGRGGSIYQWTLGFNSYAHQYAANNGYADLFRSMFARSDTKTKFLVACVTAWRDAALEIVRESNGIVASLTPGDLELVARYSWETNVDLEAVRLMLDVGFPIDHPETRHGYTALHNAAWGGYADLVDLLIERGSPLNVLHPEFGSTPLGHALHCCCVDGRHPEGEYGRVVAALIEAGCEWDPAIYPTGDPGIDAALKPKLPPSSETPPPETGSAR